LRGSSSAVQGLPKVLRTAAEFDVNMQLRRLAEEDEMAFGELAEILDDMCLAASILAKSYIWRKVPVPNFGISRAESGYP